MNAQNVAFNYRSIRTLIGVIAISIPVVCTFLFWTDQGIFTDQEKILIPTSISVTYHLGARNFFVGMLFVVGSFLLAYNGHRRGDEKLPWENILAKCAALLAVLVALFPTSFDKAWVSCNSLVPRDHGCNLPSCENLRDDSTLEKVCHVSGNELISHVHIGAAVLFIGILFFFCLRFLFRAREKLELANSAETYDPTPIQRRIVTYWVCAVGMALTLIVGAIWWRLGPEGNTAVFWVELLCLWFFGWSWLTAGKRFNFYSVGAETEDVLSESVDRNHAIVTSN